MNIALSRGSFSVELPIRGETGSPVVTTDVGAPNIDVSASGTLDPVAIDQRSRVLTDGFRGVFQGATPSDDYDNAIELADMIKSNGNGDAIDATIPLPEYDSGVLRVPAAGQEQALQLVYNPGQRGFVEVDLGLTRVQRINGGAEQEYNTPTATGTGPIQISDGLNTVDLTTDVQVTRNVGRPNSEIKPTSTDRLPYYVEHQKSAYDAFELALKFTSGVDTDLVALRDIFQQRLGSNSLTLDFNGLYNMGQFNVMPDGSQALRYVRQSGEQGTSTIPTINLRVVTN